MGVSGVAILGKENNPLYIRAFSQHDPLRFNFIVHAALDFVEEKVQGHVGAAGGGGSTSKHDLYLGMMYPVQELRVYGYMTNSHIKLIAVLDEDEVKDDQMRALFRRLHALYTDTVANPFYSPDAELSESASFDRQVERIVEAGLY